MGSGDHFSQADVPPTGHAPCSPTSGSHTSLMTPIRHLFPSHLINGTTFHFGFSDPQKLRPTPARPLEVQSLDPQLCFNPSCCLRDCSPADEEDGEETEKTTRRVSHRSRRPIRRERAYEQQEHTHTNTHKHIYTHHKAGGWRPCTCPAKVLLLFSPDKLRPLPADLPLRPALAFLRAFYDAARLQREGKKNEIRLQRRWHHPVTPNWSRCGVTSQP